MIRSSQPGPSSTFIFSWPNRASARINLVIVLPPFREITTVSRYLITMPDQTTDNAHTRLHAAGWLVGDIETLDAAGRHVWHVYAHRGEQRILARAPTQAEAWGDAWRQAALVDGESASPRLPK